MITKRTYTPGIWQRSQRHARPNEDGKPIGRSPRTVESAGYLANPQRCRMKATLGDDLVIRQKKPPKNVLVTHPFGDVFALTVPGANGKRRIE